MVESFRFRVWPACSQLELRFSSGVFASVENSLWVWGAEGLGREFRA